MVYYRCKICGEHHDLTLLRFEGKATFDTATLSDIDLGCPRTGGFARYNKKDMYWRDVERHGGDQLERKHHIAKATDERFSGLDLEYYRQRIPNDQFRLLMDSVGVHPASATFDPNEAWYPEDL